jgi:hypothetical protein
MITAIEHASWDRADATVELYVVFETCYDVTERRNMQSLKWTDFCRLPESELNRFFIAVPNLACAMGLPGVP